MNKITMIVLLLILSMMSCSSGKMLYTAEKEWVDCENCDEID